MNDYSELSDFEINSAVSMAVRSQAANPESKYVVINEYCNNPADAWPIIVSNGISLVKYGHGMWLASSDAYWVDGVEWQIDGEAHQNPLRAAMIVFLMMQDAKHA
ncbi:TPA: DUF2591 family protein [Enterobacter roggenkampii]|uniref:phage protein NinX family protein n=1 Tax=Enterobacter roggenkampii TaxID=1812935 RepID=UPI000385A09A|nr:phage protein NinX family protein [Enterobacter roggenkampii]CAH5460957.1 hypothetical protein AI2941V1_0247 [Enterobacter cloacae]EPY97126.1 hypothetical protein L799_08910 [Enterobacter roggenkampii EC_38VIM1]KTK00438.1 hypothetical protein ASU70_07510 [Enterobacter roggenkampii]MCC7579607.1 DUF2591 family protein [Enterobacter roggenkampii]MCC7588934.1 DUF2591 family protein [Enterobacter roggenkampii]